MKRALLLATAAVLSTSPAKVHATGQAEHVVVVVWDGLRPDSITPQYTPTLHELASRGTFFLNHHSAYISSTEVNGAALATGMHPVHNGIMANTEYRPDFGWLTPYGTEALDFVRRGDALSEGHYLEAATVAEILQQAGFPTFIAGAKPVGLLHDRSAKKATAAQKESVTLFAGQSIPRSFLEGFTNAPDIGAFPAPPLKGLMELTSTNATAQGAAPAQASSGRGGPSSPDSWTTKALTRGLWKKGVPKYSLLWLSEPDASQHESGPGSPAAMTALESSDRNLASVVKALEEKGVLDKTDIFVVSDHGFSTLSGGPDIIDSLRRNKFTAGKTFQNPESGDVLIVNLGGSASFYVFDHDEQVTRRLVSYLQTTDFAGVIFSAVPIDGTFPLSQANINVSHGAPDVVVAMRWTDEKSEYGVPGILSSIEGKKGRGAHGSLSPYDLHNTLVAAGPDVRKGFVDEVPSGNIDLAPTILSILGLTPQRAMDGRVLTEALIDAEPPSIKPAVETVDAARILGFLEWRQYLKFTRLGSAVYYDEGNGRSALKATAFGAALAARTVQAASNPLPSSAPKANPAP